MAIEKFEDLDVWREAMTLSKLLFNDLKDSTQYSLRDQIQRAAISIPSNIAEGFERRTNKEFMQYLYIAKGSCAELRTQLYLCQELGVIENANVEKYLGMSRKISAMLYGLIKTRRENF